MLTADQIAMRRTMLTATDLVALSGTYPSKRGACAIYSEKTECDREPEGDGVEPALESEEDDPDEIALGHLMEGPLLRMLAVKRGLVLRPGVTVRHPTESWLGATPDADVVLPPWPIVPGAQLAPATLAAAEAIAVAEAKFVGAHRFGHWGAPDEGQAAEYVLVQTQVQMTVRRVKKAYITALLGTQHLIYEVEHSPALEEMLLEVGHGFWFNHVLPRVPPPPDGTDAAWTLIKRQFPRVRRPELVSATVDQDALARAILLAREAKKAAEAQETTLKQQMALAVGDFEGIKGDGWRALYNERAGYHVDAFDVEAQRVLDIRKVKSVDEKALAKVRAAARKGQAA